VTLGRIIVVFARAPAHECRAKPLGGGRSTSARVHGALLDQALATVASVDADVVLVTTGDLDEATRRAARHVPRDRLRVRRQHGTTFGERLRDAVEGALAAGREVVVIGADTPELTPTILERAFDALTAGRATLGPSTDGGYYLLGLPRWSAAPFSVPFGGPQVGAQTKAALIADGLSVDELPTLRDLDRARDATAIKERIPRASALARALAELDESPAPPLPPRASFSLDVLRNPLAARGPPSLI
jgi:glycosyltransferase A (GT-A) superfamily protein (DUF2064 family)